MHLKFKTPLILSFLLALQSCSHQPVIDYEHRTSYYNNISTGFTSDSLITCITFNIHLGFNAFQDPWNKDNVGAGIDQVKNIAAILRQINPDVVALQEVPRNRANAIVKEFVEALALELNMNYAFGAHGYNDPYGVNPTLGEWGNAILSKFEIAAINNHQVEFVDQWERRSLIDAKLKVNDSTYVHAISLHHLPSEEGIPNTAAYVKTLSDPVLLMGDFNYVGEIIPFENVGLYDVDSTFFNHGVDRIFVNKSILKVLEIGTLKDSLFTSDHPANYSILAVKK